MPLLDKEIRKLIKYGTRFYKTQLKLIGLFIPPLILMVLRPYFVRYLIDNIVTGGKKSVLLPFLGLFIVVIIIERLASFCLNCYFVVANNTTIRSEQIHLYNHIQGLKADYFAKTSTGDIITKVLSDVQMLASPMVLSLPTIIFNFISLLTYLWVLGTFSWKLTLITICSIPFYYISLNLFTQKLQSSSRDERISFSQVNESIREKVEGIWVIKGLVKTMFFGKLFQKDIEQWVTKRNKLYIFNTAAQNITYFITAVTPVIALGYGGMSVIAGTMTLGTLIGFFSYVTWIYEPLNRINDNIIGLQMVGPVAQRFFAILDTPEENVGGSLAFPEEYSVNYENVTFAYNAEPVLKGVRLNIGENECITLVGASGAGKSTVANLLSQYYAIGGGSIKLNDRDLNDYSLAELRKNILTVRQHDYLFNLSVKDNIMLDDNFTEEEFLASVRIAGVEEFVGALADGYNTVVGERGANLSDGQKQRVALARALIRKPKILILDEATSALDSATEEKFFDRLKKLEMTVIVISHRLSTIRKADRVILLHDGQVLQTGKHEELLTGCQQYADIIAGQLTA